jgi:hypothetical protein
MNRLEKPIVKTLINSWDKAHFTNRDIWAELNIETKDGKAALRNILSDLKAECFIVSDGNGHWHKPAVTLEEMDWEKADDPPLPILWPFDLHKYVASYPRTLSVVAGASNAGKSAFCVQFAYLNMALAERIRFFNNETGVQLFKKRLEPLGVSVPPPFKVYKRDDNFQDVIDPDGFNIIDYLQVPQEAYLLTSIVDAIWNKLKTGFCLIALQKPPNRDDAFGGFQVRAHAQLYLSMNANRLKIVKAKTPVDPAQNPNDWQWTFKLRDGIHFDDPQRYYGFD